MKAAAFDLVRPASLADAIAALAAEPDARPLAGGQSLGPMLNLRLAQPRLLVQVAHLPELAGIAVDADGVTIGAGVTHAAIADGRVPDIGSGVLARIAEGIAYRAVRNRGTIGGSLCHADPAADWVCTLPALGASVTLQGPQGVRELPVADFVQGAFRTVLLPGEIMRAVRVPRLVEDAGWGYEKACRKPGDFAHAMAAVLIGGGMRRAVIGARGTRPLLLEGDAVSIEHAEAALHDLDAVHRHMQLVLLRRALAKAQA
ncbi:MAG: FAD binding domain-containing protein [Acetobacteraceae bacterium]